MFKEALKIKNLDRSGNILKALDFAVIQCISFHWK